MSTPGTPGPPNTPDAPGSPGDRLPTRLPPQATMGLLEYLTAHAVDEDYAYAAERREQQGVRQPDESQHDGAGDPGPASSRQPRRPRPPRQPRPRRLGWVGAVAVASFALLLVVAAAQTSQGAAADAEQRQQLAAQVVAQRDRLALERARVALLERETQRLQETQLASDASASGLRARVQRLGLLSGTLPARGPGVEVVVDDAVGSDSDRTRVLDIDLQRLVNGLWAAGAEAISINGQRLTNLSTIRIAGSAITVNNRGLRAPYRLLVLGDPDTLPARFAESASGQAWLDTQRQFGLRLSITPSEAMRLPASEPSLRYARAVRPDQQGQAPNQQERSTP